MKPSMIGGIAGAALGAIVAVEAHFISHTLPSSMTLPRPFDYYEGSRRLPPIPEVHPTWWPVLPIAVAVGLVVGVLAAPLWRRIAVRPRAASYVVGGAILGAVVGVLAHFAGHTLPAYRYTGFSSDGSRTLEISGPSPSARPSWLWSLPISVVAGVLLGLVVAVLQRRIARREQPVLV